MEAIDGFEVDPTLAILQIMQIIVGQIIGLPEVILDLELGSLKVLCTVTSLFSSSEHLSISLDKGVLVKNFVVVEHFVEDGVFG